MTLKEIYIEASRNTLREIFGLSGEMFFPVCLLCPATHNGVYVCHISLKARMLCGMSRTHVSVILTRERASLRWWIFYDAIKFENGFL